MKSTDDVLVSTLIVVASFGHSDRWQGSTRWYNCERHS